MRKKFNPNVFCILAIGLALSSCTYLGLEEPEVDLSDMSTTTIATATGGAIGAGLGAIVGSQTGDPGVGLVLGAAAGAGSGALIGTALERQEQTQRTQEEALNRQEQTIATQRQELDALRRMDRDAPAGATRPRYSNEPRARFQGTLSESQGLRDTTIHSSDKIVESDIAVADSPLRNRPLQRQMIDEMHSYDKDRVAAQRPASSDTQAVREAQPTSIDNPGTEKVDADAPRAALRRDSPPAPRFEMGDSSGCQNAAQEVESANRGTDPSEKLFHYRRALRLCPSRADFHAGLAETYVTLGRREDAAYEYREALNIDPNFSPALKGLDALEPQR